MENYIHDKDWLASSLIENNACERWYIYIYDTESYTTNNNLSENKFNELETKYNNIICQKVRNQNDDKKSDEEIEKKKKETFFFNIKMSV